MKINPSEKENAGTISDRCFVLIRFYGPKRNAKGKLWGYVVVAEGPHAGEEVYVSEPHGGATLLAEGGVKIARLTSGLRGLQVSDFADWTADKAGLAMLDAASSSLTKNTTGRQVLRQLVSLVPSDACPPSLVAFQPDGVLAARVRGRESFVATLSAVLSAGGSLDWLRRLRDLPKLDNRDLLRLAASLSEEQHQDLAARLIQAVGDVDEATIATLCTGAPWWREVLVGRLPAIDVLKSATLWSSLSDRQAFGVVVAAARTDEGASHAVRCVGVERLADLARQFGDTLHDFEVVSLRPSFVAAVPKLLDSLAEGTMLSLCAQIMRDAGDTANVRDAQTLAIRRLAAWKAVGPAADLAEGAKCQADVLLRFPPQMAEQMAMDGSLLPELQHILACGESMMCLEDARLHICLGHAVGALVAAVVGGRAHVADTRQRIATSLLGSDQPLTPGVAGQVLLRVADQIRVLFDDRELEHQVGALLRVLPRCTMGEAPFCEAKPPGRSESGIAYTDPFCPRTKRGCHAGVIAPALSRDAEEWGLIELVGSSGLAPFDMHGKTLINGIAGWVNRLFELRDRMTCTQCHAGLTFDPVYSKKYDAAYHSTVMECSQNCGAQAVYFNHCYSCHALIDSRESCFIEPPPEMEGFRASRIGSGRYLCLHCANGLKPWCPKCGEARARQDRSSTTCLSCGHSVDSARRATLPRISARLAQGAWVGVQVHLPEHPNWSNHSAGAALRRLAGRGSALANDQVF